MSGTAIMTVPVSRSIKYETKSDVIRPWLDGMVPRPIRGSIMGRALSHKGYTNETMRGDHVTESRQHNDRCR